MTIAKNPGKNGPHKNPRKKRYVGLTCPVEEFGQPCGRPQNARGLCKMHYERQRRTGNVLNQHRSRGPTELRFWALVDKRPEGCWLWRGRLDPSGYGRFDSDIRNKSRQRPELAHQVSWFLTYGEWPTLPTLDHECHNNSGCLGGACIHRRCVNPEHLVPKSFVDNVLSSHLHPAHRTHCAQGHLLSGENLYRTPAGLRRCRECKKIYSEKNRELIRKRQREWRRRVKTNSRK